MTPFRGKPVRAMAGIVCLMLVQAGGAAGADLSDPGYDQRYSERTYDHRYDRVYRHPAPPAEREYYERSEHYREGYAGRRDRHDREYAYGSEGDDYAARERERDRVRRDYDDHRYSEYRGGCLPRRVVRARLERRGWSILRRAGRDGELVTFLAERNSGRLFELTIDRCSGDVVAVNPRDPSPHRSYAWRRRVYDRAY